MRNPTATPPPEELFAYLVPRRRRARPIDANAYEAMVRVEAAEVLLGYALTDRLPTLECIAVVTALLERAADWLELVA